MIKYLKHHQIDKALWDETIKNASNGIIYGYSWYLDIVCKNWEAMVATDYTVVMPITRGRKYLMDYIYPPFFIQQLGVFSIQPISSELCNLFLNSIPTVFRYIEMNLHSTNIWIPDSFSSKQNKNHILDLDVDYQSIWNNYSENHQRNLKKARKNNLHIFKSANANDVITLFRNNRGRFLVNLQNEHYAMLNELVDAAATRNMSKVWIVNNQYGIPLAGAVFFESHQSGIFIFSGVSGEGKSLSAMHFLIDEYIQQNSNRLKTLDFEGSNDPELARFYKGFGSSEFVYLQIRKNQLPPPWKWFKN
ncbi:MAG: hypothetical protein IPP71_23625 [Bacteroidetes bacterium]|nr:hypothetical protein [Bacteroidota bacterium]